MGEKIINHGVEKKRKKKKKPEAYFQFIHVSSSAESQMRLE